MNKKNVPNELKGRIRKYLEYMQSSTEEIASNDSMFLSSLSNSLKEELIIFVHGNIIKTYDFVSLEFSNTLVMSLSFILEEQHFGDGEFIFYVIFI